VAYLLSLVVLAPTQRRTPPDQLEVATIFSEKEGGLWESSCIYPRTRDCHSLEWIRSSESIYNDLPKS